jgi:hypothetical protein
MVIIAVGCFLGGCSSAPPPLNDPARRYEAQDGTWWIAFDGSDSVSDANLPLFDVGIDDVAACDAGDRGQARRFSAAWTQSGYQLTIWEPSGTAAGVVLLLHGTDDWSELTYAPCGPDLSGSIVLRPVADTHS